MMDKGCINDVWAVKELPPSTRVRSSILQPQNQINSTLSSLPQTKDSGSLYPFLCCDFPEKNKNKSKTRGWESLKDGRDLE